MQFSHFIITQFNLRNFPLSDRTEYERWVNWTRNRIPLFREYCLPSLLNQTCREFKWLLFFDIDTPSEFKGFIEDLKNNSLINICYSEGADDFTANYMKEIKTRISPGDRWIVTTRIDNDDSFRRDAVELLRKNFIEKHRYLISFASGYVLNLNDMTLSHYFYPMSPFISLIESADIETSGIFERPHTRWDSLRLFVLREVFTEWIKPQERKSRFILKKPMWIQTVHGQNLSNSFYRGLPVTGSRDLSEFSLNITSTPQTVRNIVKYFNYVTWKRYLKSLVVKFLLNK